MIIAKYGYNPQLHTYANAGGSTTNAPSPSGSVAKRTKTPAELKAIVEQRNRARTINSMELPKGVPTIAEAIESAMETTKKKTIWKTLFAAKKPKKKELKDIVQSYLEIYNPVKLEGQGLEKLLAKYKSKEKLLLKMLINKYGYDPRLFQLKDELPPPPPESQDQNLTTEATEAKESNG